MVFHTRARGLGWIRTVTGFRSHVPLGRFMSLPGWSLGDPNSKVDDLHIALLAVAVDDRTVTQGH